MPKPFPDEVEVTVMSTTPGVTVLYSCVRLETVVVWAAGCTVEVSATVVVVVEPKPPPTPA